MLVEHKHCNTTTADLITEKAINDNRRVAYTVWINTVEMQNKRMIHVQGKMEIDGTRLYHATQNFI